MYVVGIDENGYGPKLGVLCVTGTVFECGAGYRREDFWSCAGDAKVGDSKRILSFGNLSEGERTVLTYTAILENEIPKSAAGILKVLSFSELEEIQSRCPGAAREICWGGDFPLPYFSRVDLGKVRDDAGGTKSRMREKSISLLEARTYVCCPREFNIKIDEGRNKVALEFSIFERLFERFHRKYGSDILFLCGKLGGTRRYARFFGYLSRFEVLTCKEEDGRSAYGLKDFGEVEFIRDGDSEHFPIALSSIFGKYVREIFVKKANRFFASRIPGLEEASGYNDRNTRQFIRRTEDLRRRMDIPLDCFQRKR